MAVLDRIDATLRESLTRVDALKSPTAAPAPVEPSPLQTLDDRLARMQTCLERAQQHADEADALLVGETDGLQQWLASVGNSRQRLQDWIDRVRR
jgi:hypothetical protein